MTTTLVPEGSKVFACNICHYNTCRKSQYDRHLTTSKHNNNVKTLQTTTNLVQKVPEYVCKSCNKIYKHHSSLWNHKKKCNNVKNNYSEKDELISYLIKENQ